MEKIETLAVIKYLFIKL